MILQSYMTWEAHELGDDMVVVLRICRAGLAMFLETHCDVSV